MEFKSYVSNTANQLKIIDAPCFIAKDTIIHRYLKIPYVMQEETIKCVSKKYVFRFKVHIFNCNLK